MHGAKWTRKQRAGPSLTRGLRAAETRGPRMVSRLLSLTPQVLAFCCRCCAWYSACCPSSPPPSRGSIRWMVEPAWKKPLRQSEAHGSELARYPRAAGAPSPPLPSWPQFTSLESETVLGPDVLTHPAWSAAPT